MTLDLVSQIMALARSRSEEIWLVAASSGQRGCGHCAHLHLPFCACLRPLELPSLGIHLLMHVSGHSDMTLIRKRSACAGSFRGESSAATIGRVPDPRGASAGFRFKIPGGVQTAASLPQSDVFPRVGPGALR